MISLSKYRHRVSLVMIFVLAGLIRLISLSSNPPSLNWDEASLGYNAYSILKTGHDEWGRWLPLSFEAFGEYKLPGYIYTTVPSVAIFGLNEFGVRFPSAFFGSLTCVLAYLLLYRLTSRRLAGVAAGLLLAITPWHIFLSRTAVEANLALFFITLASYLFIKAIFDKSRWYPWAMVSFLAAVFTYNSARVFVPLFVGVLGVLYWKSMWQARRIAFVSIAAFFVIYIAAIPVTVKEGAARYQDVTILDSGAINRINEHRGSTHLPGQVARLVYNKATYAAYTTASNYLTYFLPNYFFIKGGSQFQFSVPNTFLLYWVEGFLLLCSLIVIIKARLFQAKIGLIVAWMLLAPIPAAITRETPHVLRSYFMVVPLCLLCALGLQWLLDRVKRQLFQVIVILGLIIAILPQALSYFVTYQTHYRQTYSCSWQYGTKAMAEYVLSQQAHYDRILITKKYGEPHIFLLFYGAIDPKNYYQDPQLIRYHNDNHDWVDRFGKIDFVNDWELQTRLQALTNQNVGRLLVVTSPNNYPRNTRAIKTDYFLNGQPVFDYLSFEPNSIHFSNNDLHPPAPERGCDYSME